MKLYLISQYYKNADVLKYFINSLSDDVLRVCIDMITIESILKLKNLY